ncbi:MAG: rhomboid family intramembrane serine protease [Bacteroidota bacterium]
MPKQEQTIPIDHPDKETALALGYEVMKNAGWTIQFAGIDKIQAHTPRNWKTYGQQIVFGLEGDQLMISSELVNGEAFDMGGKNKKNISQFIAAFAGLKNSTSTTTIETNKAAIDVLRAVTVQTVTETEQKVAEVNAAMNLKGDNLNVTYTLIGINVLIFILMAANGAGIFDANGLVHIAWGSNYAPLTLSGDWWRLITCTFLHFGIIHLAMNMYCLYMVGSYLEPMLGKPKFIAAYLCTGVFASLVSLWWHKEAVNSAGASGAVFGMFGLFLALLTTNLIPKQVRQSLLQSIGIFIAFNLFYGMKGGVDNSAHIGGLVSGFIIGYLYVYGIKKEKQGQKTPWIIAVLILITVGVAYGYLQQNSVSDTERREITNAVKTESYKDNSKFQTQLKSFDEFHSQARDYFSDTSLTDQDFKTKIAEVSLPAWKNAEEAIAATKAYDISPESHAKADKLLEYIGLRKEELEILKQMLAEGSTEDLLQKLETVRTKADAVYGEAIAL